MPRIKITYAITTPESAAAGDHAETGWTNEEGVDMAPDRFDAADGIDAVDNAVNFLRRNGATEPSSSAFHKGVWYSWADAQQDYRTGEDELRSFHLDGFTEAQERAIYEELRSG